jgi:hypothetical protein
MRRSLEACACVMLATGAAVASANVAERPSTPAGTWNVQARVLAGLPLTSADGATTEAVAGSAAVRRHAAAMTEAWEGFRTQRLVPGQRFAAGAVGPHEAARGPVFYPFGGPDAVWPVTLFPAADRFVLVGLEPPGHVPDLVARTEEAREQTLAQVRRSLQSAVRFSFFRTNDMSAELPNNKASGVLPLVLVFLARQGHSIEGVQHLGLAADGTLAAVEAGEKPRAVRVTFRPSAGGDARTLVYLRADLSDGGLAGAPEVMRFLESYRHRATFLKAASYLMHSDRFSTIREHIVARSSLVLQDDSGVPFRHLSRTGWTRNLYGMYDGPIALFANKYQRDLRDAYDAGAQPLDFGIGYDHRSKTSNMQLFVRTGAAGDAAAAEPVRRAVATPVVAGSNQRSLGGGAVVTTGGAPAPR